MIQDPKKHLENIYQTKKSNEVSWHQEKPKTSLNLISETGIDKDAKIIDVGAGDSKLVNNLLARGFRDITALDVSSNALNRAKIRLGDRANDVKWVVSDLREFETKDRYDLWHDRAVLHFLTREEDISKYVETARRFLNQNGYMIVSTFSFNGPKKCSGLNITQYSKDLIRKIFQADFCHISSFEEIHTTPFNTKQNFLFNLFKRNNA